jgi:hypothetical protein
MNFKQTATVQGSFGFLVSLVLFVKPTLLLMFVAPSALAEASANSLSVTLVRLLALFLGGLCVTLLASRYATEPAVQRSVLLAHVATDFTGFVVVTYFTFSAQLVSPGGYILAIVLLANALGYVPCYLKLPST